MGEHGTPLRGFSFVHESASVTVFLEIRFRPMYTMSGHYLKRISVRRACASTCPVEEHLRGGPGVDI